MSSPLFRFVCTEGPTEIVLLPTSVYGIWGMIDKNGEPTGEVRVVTRERNKEWVSTEPVEDLLSRWEASLAALSGA